MIMKIITSWSTLICLSSAACAVIELIMPPGNMAKTLRMILGLFMLVSFVFPFSNGISKFNTAFKTKKINDKPIRDFVNGINKQIESLAENNLKAVIEQILSEMGVENEKTEIFMDTGQDNCISISRCKVYIKRNFRKSDNNSSLTNSDLLKIKKELEKRINIETEVFICD